MSANTPIRFTYAHGLPNCSHMTCDIVGGECGQCHRGWSKCLTHGDRYQCDCQKAEAAYFAELERQYEQQLTEDWYESIGFDRIAMGC